MKRSGRWLVRFGCIGVWVLLFVACGAPGVSSNTPTPNASAATALPRTQTDKQALEIYSTWGPGAELDALAALEGVYHNQHSGIRFVLGTTGGGGGGTDELLLMRLRREQPPDTFVVHAGQESLDYVNRGQLEPITKFFHQEGFDQVMPPLLLQQITIKGEIYTVPVNIHRSNVLFYNPKVFQTNNLQPPGTIQEFYTVAEKLQAKGITPLAIGGSFELGQLFECVLLATYGPQDYVRLVQGDPTLWEDSRLTAAIQTFGKMLAVSNADRPASWWGSAAQSVLEGKAGMTITGDWLNGSAKSGGAKPNVDFAWVPAPGTDGAFMWLSDSFSLPKGAPHRDAALAWLRVAGSKAGQDAFNPIKGSIPARLDADKSLYDEYQSWSIDQFRTSQLAPSIVHGAATSDSFRSAYARAAIDFSNDLDEKAFAEALQEAAAMLTSKIAR